MLGPWRSNPPATDYGRDLIDWEEEDACDEGGRLNLCDSVPIQIMAESLTELRAGLYPKESCP